MTVVFFTWLTLAGLVDRESDVRRLEPFAGLVGQWKGTGQVRPGALRDAWRESVDWSWAFSENAASLQLRFDSGKYLREAKLRPAAQDAAEYELDAVMRDGRHRQFRGRIDEEGTLRLVATEPEASGVSRLTIIRLHEARFLIQIEGLGPDGSTRIRLGQVGYTKQGVAFAAGSGDPVCVVTGGKGTTPVIHGGRTYYVCCSGCLDLFNEDPEKVLREAAEAGWIGTKKP